MGRALLVVKNGSMLMGGGFFTKNQSNNRGLSMMERGGITGYGVLDLDTMEISAYRNLSSQEQEELKEEFCG